MMKFGGLFKGVVSLLQCFKSLASSIFIENLPAAKVYFENHYTIMFLIDFINLIKNILVGVLIYETV